MKKIIFIVIFILFYLQPTTYNLQPKTASAQTPTCSPIFGGGTSCETHPDLSINKQAQDPDSKKYQENLSIITNYLSEDQTITFRIIIKNTSNNTLSNIAISDVLPQTIVFRSGNAKFDPNTRTISDTINKLEKGHTKTYEINTTVNTTNLKNSTACSVNQAVISQGGKTGSGYVKFCLNTSQTGKDADDTRTKGGLPIFNQKAQTKTPDTGPELIGIIGLPTLAGIGYLLRRKALVR